MSKHGREDRRFMLGLNIGPAGLAQIGLFQSLLPHKAPLNEHSTMSRISSAHTYHIQPIQQYNATIWEFPKTGDPNIAP